MICLVSVNMVLTLLMPNTKALWNTPVKKPKDFPTETNKKLLSVSETSENQDAGVPGIVVTPAESKKNRCAALSNVSHKNPWSLRHIHSKLMALYIGLFPKR